MQQVNIDYVHVCELAFLGQNGGLNIIQAFDRISSREFPAGHPRFAVVVGVSAPEGEHNMSIEVVNENAANANEKIVAQASGTASVKAGGSARFFIDFFNTKFPTPGTYKVYVYVGDETRVQNLVLEQVQEA